jgi:hypothetical protein
VNFSAIALHGTSGEIDGEISELQYLTRRGLVGRFRRAAQQGFHTSQKLFEIERLDEVVVGSGAETGHAIGDGIAGGEHEDRQ